MRWIVFLVLTVATVAGVVVFTAPASGDADGEAVPNHSWPAAPQTGFNLWSTPHDG